MAFTKLYGMHTSDKTAGNSWGFSYAANFTYPIAVGTLMVVAIALDNASSSTTDGDNGDVTSISDAYGNTYTKAKMFSNAQTGAGTGATAAIWYCVTTNSITASNTLTINFSASVTAKAASVTGFSFTSGNAIALEGSGGTLANDGADAGAITLSSLTSRSQYLFIRCTAMEGATTAPTLSTNYSTMGNSLTGTGTSGGGAASNMSICSEYRILSSPGSSESTDPSTGLTVDCASVMIALYEYAVVAKPRRVIRLRS